MRFHHTVRIAATLLALPALAVAQRGGEALRQGFSTARLARIDSAMQGAVDRGEIAGAVALVMRDGRTVYEPAFGWSDREAGRRMEGPRRSFSGGVDPRERLVLVFMIQQLPNRSSVPMLFPMLVYQVLVEPR
jgi:CubicO group peptidase (beta-lactamase class C family)